VSRSPHLRWLVLVAAVACIATALPASAQESSDSIDILQASREEVRQEVAALDQRIAQETAAVEDAKVAAAKAAKAVGVAQAKVDLARIEVELARERVREYAIEAFVRPPAADALAVLSIKKVEEASNANNLLQIVADRRASVIGTMVTRQRDLERQQQETVAAKVQAEARVDQIRSSLESVKTLREEQSSVAASLDERLNAALAEAAALQAVNAEVAEQLAAQEVALRDSAPPAPEDSTPPAEQPAPESPTSTEAPSSTDSPSTTRPGGGSATPTPTPAPTTATTIRRSTTTVPRTTTTVVRRPLPPIPSNLPGWSDMTRVGSIWVNRSIATRMRGLLDAATASGVSLGGGGYRSSASQIALRQAHCGSDSYAIYQMPASRCRPPTARPGSSMHERGLAVDFTANGSLIVSRSNVGYQWLAANASRFGFFNLPSEPWHWSINGN